MADLVSVTVAQGWPVDRPGGLNRYAADLHVGLLEAGLDDRLVVFGPARSAGPGVHPAGDEDEPLPRRLAALTRGARCVGEGADLLATHFALYGSLPALLPPLRRRPLVAHFHGPWAQESLAGGARGAGPRVKRAVERAHLRSADAVVTASRAFADLAIGLHGLDAARVHAIHPGVDLARFHPLDAAPRAALRAELGVAPGSSLVVTARRLVPRMGLEQLLRAWPGADGVELVVIGDGVLRPTLEAAASELSGVRLTGRVDDARLVQWYQAADVVVVPSLSLEGFGLVVLEALACGTPVLASAVGGMGEVLPGLDPSLLLPPEDAAAWRARLTGPGLRDVPTRQRCREFTLDHSTTRFAAEVAELYRHVAGDRGRTSPVAG